MEENKFLHFIRQHWSKLLLSVLTLACLLVWGERFFTSNRSQNRDDFFVANKIFEKLQKGEILPVETVETVEKILARHPELHTKFDAPLALAFLSQHNAAKGLVYAHAALDKVGGYLPAYYQTFAQTGFCIVEEQFLPAFEEASTLCHQLENRPEYEVLHAMNLLRLLFLAEKLNLADAKQEAWGKLKLLPVHESLKPLFHEGSLSLEDYMQTNQ